MRGDFYSTLSFHVKRIIQINGQHRIALENIGGGGGVKVPGYGMFADFVKNRLSGYEKQLQFQQKIILSHIMRYQIKDNGKIFLIMKSIQA